MFMAVLICLTLYWNCLKFSYRTLARQISVTIELKDKIIRMKSLCFILVFTNSASVMCLGVCWLVGQGFRNRRKHAFSALLDWTMSRAQPVIRNWDRVLLCRKNLLAFERVSVCRGGNHCQVTYIPICCTQLMIDPLLSVCLRGSEVFGGGYVRLDLGETELFGFSSS